MNPNPQPHRKPGDYTDRELQVLALRKKGMSGTVIARELKITRARVYQILDSIAAIAKEKGA